MAHRVAILPLKMEPRPDQAPVGLENLLRDIPGVIEVGIDPIGELVRLAYDDDRVDLMEITRQLKAHGYPTGTPITTEGEL